MYLSVAALVVVLRLVAAAPCHQTHEGNMARKVNFGSPSDECDLSYDRSRAYSCESYGDRFARSMPIVTKANHLGGKAHNHGSSETLIRVALATCDNDNFNKEVFVPEPVGADYRRHLRKTTAQSINTDIHGSENLENGIDKSFIQVDVPSTPQSTFKSSTQSLAPMSELAPGWILFNEKTILGRIHGITYWTIKGQLDEKFPFEEYMFDPLLFSLNHPTDFEGEFTGEIGRGQIVLTWGKSRATIKGRSGIGEFTIKGKTTVDWSP